MRRAFLTRYSPRLYSIQFSVKFHLTFYLINTMAYMYLLSNTEQEHTLNNLHRQRLVSLILQNALLIVHMRDIAIIVQYVETPSNVRFKRLIGCETFAMKKGFFKAKAQS